MGKELARLHHKKNMVQNVTQGLGLGQILSNYLTSGKWTCDLELEYEESLYVRVTQVGYKRISKVHVRV
jgi:hypothetical protein